MLLETAKFDHIDLCNFDNLLLVVDGTNSWIDMLPCCRMQARKDKGETIAHIPLDKFLDNPDKYIGYFCSNKVKMDDVYMMDDDEYCCQWSLNRGIYRRCIYTYKNQNQLKNNLLIGLGDYCNNNCIYCSVRRCIELNESNTSEYLKKFINNFTKWNTFELIEVDGHSEITLECLRMILQKFTNNDYKGRIALNTNGIIDYTSTLESYIDLSRVEINMSLDTIDREIAKKLYGKDILDILLKNYAHYKEKKILHRIHHVITDINSDYEDTEKFIDYFNGVPTTFLIDCTCRNKILNIIEHNGVLDLLKSRGCNIQL